MVQSDRESMYDEQRGQVDKGIHHAKQAKDMAKKGKDFLNKRKEQKGNKNQSDKNDKNGSDKNNPNSQNPNKASNPTGEAGKEGAKEAGKEAGKEVGQKAAEEAGKKAAQEAVAKGAEVATGAAAGAATGGLATVAQIAASQLKDAVLDPENSAWKFFALVFLIILIPIILVAMTLLPVIALLFVLFPNMLDNSSSKENAPVATESLLYQSADEKTKKIIDETLDIKRQTFIASKNAKAQEPIHKKNEEKREKAQGNDDENPDYEGLLNEYSSEIEGDGYMGKSIWIYADPQATIKIGTVKPGTTLVLAREATWDGGNMIPIEYETGENAKNNRRDRDDVIEWDGTSNPEKEEYEMTTGWVKKGNAIENKHNPDPYREFSLQDEYDVITISMVAAVSKVSKRKDEELNKEIAKGISNHDEFGKAVGNLQSKPVIYASLRSDDLSNNILSAITFGAMGKKKQKGLAGVVSYDNLDIDGNRSNINPTLDGFDVNKSSDNVEGGFDADGSVEELVSRLVASYAVSKSDTLPDKGYFRSLDGTMKTALNDVKNLKDISFKKEKNYRLVDTYIEGKVTVPRVERKQYWYYLDKDKKLSDYPHYFLSPNKLVNYSNLDDVDYANYNSNYDTSSEYAFVSAKDGVPSGVSADVVLTAEPIPGRKDGVQKSFPVVEGVAKIDASKKPIPVKYPFDNYFIAAKFGKASTASLEQVFFKQSKYYKSRLEALGYDPNADWLGQISDGAGGAVNSAINFFEGNMDDNDFTLSSPDLGHTKPYISHKSKKYKDDKLVKQAVHVGDGLLQNDGSYLIVTAPVFGDIGQTVDITIGELKISALIVGHRGADKIDPITRTSLKDDSYFSFIVDTSKVPDQIKAVKSYEIKFEGPVTYFNQVEANRNQLEQGEWKALMTMPYYPEVLSYIYTEGNQKVASEKGWIAGKVDEYGNIQYFHFPESAKGSHTGTVYTKKQLPPFYRDLLPDSHKSAKLIEPIPNYGTSITGPSGEEANQASLWKKMTGLFSGVLVTNDQEYRRSPHAEEISVQRVNKDGTTVTKKRKKTVEDKIIEWTGNIREQLITNEELAGSANQGGGVNMASLLAAEIGNAGGKKYKEFAGLDTKAETTDRNAWEAAFVSYMMDKADALSKTKKTGSIQDLYNHHKANLKPNDNSYEPKVGDIVFFDNGSGVGIVSSSTKVEGKISIKVVRGNQDGSGAREGDNWLGVVAESSHEVGQGFIAGYVPMNLSASGGRAGASVASNGQSHSAFLPNVSYNELPENIRNSITLDLFKDIDWGSSPFQGELAGQCTELTWAYMCQLWGAGQPTMGDGGNVYQSYEAAGAKITTEPTVGYGFSIPGDSSYGGYGHTGVVVGVLDDGSWISANFNMGAYRAYGPNHRKVSYILHPGSDGRVKFFSGVGGVMKGNTGNVSRSTGGSNTSSSATTEGNIANTYITALDKRYDLALHVGGGKYRMGIGLWDEKGLGAVFKEMKKASEGTFTKLANNSGRLSESIKQAGETGEWKAPSKLDGLHVEDLKTILNSALGKKAQRTVLQNEAKEVYKELKDMKDVKLDDKARFYVSAVAMIQRSFNNERKINWNSPNFKESIQKGKTIKEVHKAYYRDNKEVYNAYSKPFEKNGVFNFSYFPEKGLTVEQNEIVYLLSNSIVRAKKYSEKLSVIKKGSASGAYQVGTDEVKKEVWKFLKALGYSDEAAAAVMGNMEQESGVNPSLIQGNLPFDDAIARSDEGGYGMGLIQWDGGRRAGLMRFADQHNKPWNDLQLQFDYYVFEMNGSENRSYANYGGYEAFKKGTNIEELTLYYCTYIERAGIPRMEVRYKAAHAYYEMFKGTE